ncbi:hypothetical protein, partial [Corynebacterium variabile]|uniref:hypothetical protein n=1 Tax=Corynebacterium variabile TaxID=1727 RepID=UPI003F9EAB24
LRRVPSRKIRTRTLIVRACMVQLLPGERGEAELRGRRVEEPGVAGGAGSWWGPRVFMAGWCAS